MRKATIGSVVVTAAVLGGTVLAATPAQAYAGTPGCVTTKEYRSITNGMTQRQVANRFGTAAHPYWGTVTFNWDSDYSREIDREYKRCSSTGKPLATWSHGSVEVDFEDEADWDTGQWAGVLTSTYKNRSIY
jgi:hypothetical protein